MSPLILGHKYLKSVIISMATSTILLYHRIGRIMEKYFVLICELWVVHYVSVSHFETQDAAPDLKLQ